MASRYTTLPPLLLLLLLAMPTIRCDESADAGAGYVSVSSAEKEKCIRTFNVEGSFTGQGNLVSSTADCQEAVSKVPSTDAYVIKGRFDYAVRPSARITSQQSRLEVEGEAAHSRHTQQNATGHPIFHPRAMFLTRWGASSVYHRLFDHVLPAWILCHHVGACGSKQLHPTPTQVYILDEGGGAAAVPHRALDHLESLLFGAPWIPLRVATNITSEYAVVGGWGDMHLYHWGRGSKNQHGFVWRDELAPWLSKLRSTIFRSMDELGHVDQACTTLKAAPAEIQKTPLIWMLQPGARKGDTGGTRGAEGTATFQSNVEGAEATIALLKAHGYTVDEVDMGMLSLQKASVLLSCPKILIGIEGPAFANSLLLRSGGMVQLSLMKPSYAFDGNLNVVSGLHSSVAQYFPEVQDSQYYTRGNLLHPAQVLTVVDEMNHRVQQQQHRLYRQQQRDKHPNATVNGATATASNSNGTALVRATYSYRQYFGPAPNPQSKSKQSFWKRLVGKKDRVGASGEGQGQGQGNGDAAGRVVEQWPAEIPVRWKQKQPRNLSTHGNTAALVAAVRRGFVDKQGDWHFLWQGINDNNDATKNENNVPAEQFQDGTCRVLRDAFINWYGLVVTAPASAAEDGDGGGQNQYVNGAPPCLADPSVDGAAFNAGVLSAMPVHTKVISFAGKWQDGVWHFLFEALSNIEPLLPIPTDVVVHVAQKNAWALQWLHLLGVGAEFGHTVVDRDVRADTAFFPKLGNCGGNSEKHIQFLRTAIDARLDEVFGGPAPPCNDLLLLRRTKSRQLGGAAFQEVYERMEGLAAEKGMTLSVFDDGYLSSQIVHQLHHFRRACAVVAPHGAGLTMLLGMQAGNCAIEVHPKERDRQYMYESLSGSLGLQYPKTAGADGGSHLQYEVDAGVDGGADAIETALRGCKSYADRVKKPVR